jgi:hypothetical protein
MLSLTGKHSPDLSWTLNPVAEQPLLEDAWYACQWALYGPFAPGTKQFERLRYPTYEDIVGCSQTVPRQYHLAMLDEYCQIPCGWLGVGQHCAPHGACYQAHCGETFVWVMPENLPSLSEFTLVLLDIATIDPSWLALQLQQPVVSVQRDTTVTPPTTPATPTTDSTKNSAKVTETWSACQKSNLEIDVAPFADHLPMKGITVGPVTIPTITGAPSMFHSNTYVAPGFVAPTDWPVATSPAPPYGTSLPPATVHTYRQ